MVHQLTALFRKARHILKLEGLIPLIRRGLAFLAGCLLYYETYYVYEYRMNERSEPNFTLRNREFIFKIVSTNEQADELVADGFELLSQDGSHRERLNRGAIAFCMFVERQLCHISWVALNKQAKAIDNDIPFPVDFSNNEAYLGWTAKTPNRLRTSRGFPVYLYFAIMQFLRRRGIRVCRFIVGKRNTITQNILARKTYTQPYGEGYFLKLFSWKIWRERRLTPEERARVGYRRGGTLHRR